MRDYGTATSGHGLYGYSYGGLLSLHTWLTGYPLFESVGAGSPGVASADSQHAAKPHVTASPHAVEPSPARSCTKHT